MTRKITKATLDELEKEMAPLTEQEQQARLGGAGYDEGDSWWRCIEYFKSGGDTDVTPHEAMLIAKMYYGDSFNASEYSFTGSIADMRECIMSSMRSWSKRLEMGLFTTMILRNEKRALWGGRISKEWG